MRIRTISNCVAELKAEDPRTPICEKTIRRAIREGTLPYKRNGRLFFVTVEQVKKCFEPEEIQSERSQ